MNKEARRVSRAIALALALIAEQDPELARLLGKSIKDRPIPVVLVGVTGEPSPQNHGRQRSSKRLTGSNRQSVSAGHTK
jgi:hypothetical protein